MTRYAPAFPKPVRMEDAAYLRFIRRQGCLLHSQIAAEAHHVTTRGAGGSDYRTVPLCRIHHHELHRRGLFAFEVKYSLHLAQEQLRLLEMYLSALKEGDDLGEAMRLNLDTVHNMTAYGAANLALEAIEEEDRASFWLLCGVVTAKIDSKSKEATALWDAGHEPEGNIEKAVEVLRRLLGVKEGDDLGATK